jgi:glycosyltransferase involved in cell wall biosynthesis
MFNMILSVIIPVFNEEKTIELILKRVTEIELNYGVKIEIIIVNDFSTDKSDELIKSFMAKNSTGVPISYFKHEKNSGKGCAIRTGINQATGDLVIIQDADLEYDPSEFNTLLNPFITKDADVVYGSRFASHNERRVIFYYHTLGNKLLTLLSNLLSDLNFTDMETCYKMFKSSIIKNITLRENRFGFEPEVTAKIAKIKNIKIFEVGVSYNGRTYEDGKKIGWKDGFRAIYCIIKYSIFSK